MQARKRTKFLAEVKDKKGQQLTISFSTFLGSLSEAKSRLEEMGYEAQKIVYARDHHICKYCGRITESSYKDLLCTDCRWTFGHSLYSEL